MINKTRRFLDYLVHVSPNFTMHALITLTAAGVIQWHARSPRSICSPCISAYLSFMIKNRREFGKYENQEWSVYHTFYIDQVGLLEYYGVRSRVFVVIYYLVP